MEAVIKTNKIIKNDGAFLTFAQSVLCFTVIDNSVSCSVGNHISKFEITLLKANVR